MDVIADYAYTAQEEDELTLKVGDIIRNVAKEEGGWWRGSLDGKEGVFPDNFVKDLPADQSPRSPKHGKQSANNVGGSVAALAGRLAKDMKMGPTPGPAPTITQSGDAKKPVKAKVTYSYSPDNADELALSTGDVVDILKQEEEGWWYGSLDGQSGLFPSNFVEIIDDFGANKSDKEDVGDSQNEISGKKVKGIGLGNIFSAGPITLRPVPRNVTPSPRPAENKRKSPTESPTQTPALPPREAESEVEKAQAIFAYDADNEDELSLKEGDIITVLQKDLQDVGWWRGEHAGRVGVFPDNFVKIIASSQQSDIPVQNRAPPPVPSVNSKPKQKMPVERPPADRPPAERPPPPAREKLLKEEIGLDIKPSRPAVVPPKPALPVHSKRPRHDDTKLCAQTDDQKVKNQKPLPEPAVHSVKTPAPSKQNTSQSIRIKNEKVDKEDTTNELTVDPPVPTRTHEVSLASKRTVPPPPDVTHPSADKHAPARPTAVKKERRSPPSTPTAKQKPDNSIDASILEELRREMEELKASTVRKEDYDSLHSELQQQRKDIDILKQNFNKRLIGLMNEVDEEKKLRVTMEVEVKRIKDLVTNT